MTFRLDRYAFLVPVGALALLMAATRFHHFGSPVHLPDASLAMFFLAGVLLSWRWFPVFALLAAGIDYAAIVWGGVSDYCVTPAYAFLLPTYAAMTFGGGLAKRLLVPGILPVARFTGLAALSAAVAFVISNGSFYFFSGYFGQMTYAEYLARTGGYAVPYVSWSLFYSLAGFGVILLARRFRAGAVART